MLVAIKVAVVVGAALAGGMLGYGIRALRFMPNATSGAMRIAVLLSVALAGGLLGYGISSDILALFR